jgi:hypothetical protein
MAQTTRERIAIMEAEMTDTEVSPARASEMLMQATAIHASCVREATKRELVYNHVLNAYMSGDEPAARATIRAKASDEYAAWQQARDEAGICLEHVRSLKKFLEHQREEMRLSKY